MERSRNTARKFEISLTMFRECMDSEVALTEEPDSGVAHGVKVMIDEIEDMKSGGGEQITEEITQSSRIALIDPDGMMPNLSVHND